MKNLRDYINESIVNERLMDDWFNAFEYCSKEKFASYGPKGFIQYLTDNGFYDNGDPTDKLKNFQYLGQKCDTAYYTGSYDTMRAYIGERGGLVLARGKDGKMYSNDSDFMEKLGLTPKPNKKFDKKSFDDDFSGKTVGYELLIPEYKK